MSSKGIVVICGQREFLILTIMLLGTVNWGNLGNRGNLSKRGMPSLTTFVGHAKYFWSKIHMRLLNFVIFLCRSFSVVSCFFIPQKSEWKKHSIFPKWEHGQTFPRSTYSCYARTMRFSRNICQYSFS